jgi:hypothetical protein
VNSDQQADNEAETLEQRVSEEPEWQQEHLISWVFSAPFQAGAGAGRRGFV